MATTNDVFVELTENVDRIEVHFKFDADDVRAVKSINGRKWDQNRRFWTVPMTMVAARALREIFGDRMKLGPALRVWAKEQRKHERNLRSLNAANDAKLEHTPEIIMDVIAGRPIDLPRELAPRSHVLRKQRGERSYQRADIKMMSMSSAINGNDVGTGKTIEAIAAIFEAELNPKPVLVIAPRRALVSVWQTEFRRWAFSDYECWASEVPSERLAYTNYLAADLDDPSGVAICLIADDVRLEKYFDIKRDTRPDEHDPLHARVDYKGNWYKFRDETQRDLYQVEFGAVIIDEFHNVGLPNRTSLFSLGVNLLKVDRKWPMSATPIGGKPRRLWPILNFIDPKQYSSEWAWIDEWLDVTEETFYKKGDRRGSPSGKSRNVGGIRPEREQEFYEHHRMHLIRRTKKDALPGIPDALEIVIDTPMSGRQLEEYRRFDADHEIILGKKRLSGANVLAQYKRLRQMANSRLTFYSDSEKSKPEATSDSCKIAYLLDQLDDCGIRKTDFEDGARAYIGVLDKSFLTVVIEALEKAGIDCDRLDGGTKDSTRLINKFASDNKRPYVIAMTMQTGGTALNLERAGSAHALDEEWDPDIMTQFFGRGDRGARETPLKCFIYRTPQSIQEYVAEVAEGKSLNNVNVLDFAGDIERMREEGRCIPYQAAYKATRR